MPRVVPGLPVLLGIAFAARLAWVLAVPPDLYSDPAVYDRFARVLAATGVYGWDAHTPTAYWALGAPAMYGGLYWLVGPAPAAVAALNIALSLLIVWLTVRLGEAWFGRGAGLLAGLFVALWPALIQFTLFPNSELVFTALLLGALLAWSRPAPWAVRAALAGGLLGLAALVRPIALLIPLVLVFARSPSCLSSTGSCSADRGLGPRRRLAAAALALACMAAVVAPWSLRNHAVFGEVVLVSTNFGPNFWMGNNPDSTGRYQPLPPRVDGMSETARDAALRAEAVEYIRRDPGGFARRFVVKVGYLFSRETTGVTWSARGLEARYGPEVVAPLKAASTAYWYAMLLMAAAGAIRLARAHGAASVVLGLPVLLVAYFAGVHGVIFVSDRFHLPLNPLLALLAACAWLPPPRHNAP